MLTEALEGGDYVALAQAVGERVAPRVGGGAYATALVDALGARALVRVAAHLPAGGGGVTGRAGSGGSGTSSTGPGVPLACTWTSLLATATTSPLWTDDHREALARDLAALVTTTGDVAEPDTLLLPLGFRRLLTADQDPLTTAAAGTQAPGAGGGQSGTRGARDPLALDPKFLASLVRGVMAGETGATTGGSRVGWVEYARLTTTAGGGYSNFPGGTPREVRARYSFYDPLAAVLTAAARAPATVLDVLAPPVSGPDPRTLGPSRRDTVRRVLATRVEATTWEWVAARAQGSGPACLEALTAAVASASTLRYRPTAPRTNPYEARAAWLTEQATITLAGVDATTWTPPARRAAAVVLANSVGDLWDAATGGVYARGYQPFYRSLPVAWSGRHDVEVTVLLREVLKDDTALAVLLRAVGVLAARHLLSAALTARAPGSWAQAKDSPWKAAHAWLLVVAGRGATLEGYLYSACATGRGVGEDEESPAAGVALAALVQGLDLHGLDLHAPWRPPGGPLAAPGRPRPGRPGRDRWPLPDQPGPGGQCRLRPVPHAPARHGPHAAPA